MTDEGITVLVIDDEEVIHASIKRILSRFGYKVEGVFNATEGLERLKSERFDAVITDLMMPGMNGLEMLEVMKAQSIDVPTIMITGYPTIKTAVEALRLGAVDYIPKPFTRQELLSPLKRALRRKSDGDEGRRIAIMREAVEPASEEDLVSGSQCFLPEHSWVVYNQDGTADIGVEESFINAVPPIEAVELPVENELVEQGYTGLQIQGSGETHCVFMPLSGRVLAVNAQIVENPSLMTPRTWLIRILPSQVKAESSLLKKRRTEKERGE